MIEDRVVYPKGSVVSSEFRSRFLVNNSILFEAVYSNPLNWYFVIKEVCSSCEDPTSIDSLRFPSKAEAQEALDLVKKQFPEDCLFEGPYADTKLVGYEVRKDVTEKDILHGIRAYIPEYQVVYLREFGLEYIVDRYFKEETISVETIKWSKLDASV